jgi:hypothetical protein
MTLKKEIYILIHLDFLTFKKLSLTLEPLESSLQEANQTSLSFEKKRSGVL